MPTITGTAAAERLDGTAQDDVLIGLGGNDTLNGGAGFDTADYETAPGRVVVDLRTGTGQDGFGGADSLISIEHVAGSENPDTLIGDGQGNYLNGRGGNDELTGNEGDDILIGGWGNDTLDGGAGNDLLQGGDGFDVLRGGDGFDTADYSVAPAGIAADLYSGTWDDTFNSIENLIGSNFADVLRGDWRDNILQGGAGDDILEGREGADQLTGGAGADQLDGGDGVDTAFYSGARSNYDVRASAGGWIVTDVRGGSPDGTDTLKAVEFLQFSDMRMSLSSGGPINPAVAEAVTNILRLDPATSPLAADLSSRVAAGSLSPPGAVAEIVRAADETTSVATLSYQFFTGKIPGLSGIDYLVSPTGPNPNNLNSAYYQSFNLENRYINFAVNLGKLGEGRAQFEGAYGGLNLHQATAKAYEEIFGLAPTADKVTALLSGGRDVYFESYGRDGLNGIGTKAAMVGWLLAEAEKADVGMYARSNAAFLGDLADGATFAVDLIGVYGRAEYDYGG